MQSCFTEMVCRNSVLAQARVFPTPLPSLCLPLLVVLLVDFYGLLSSGSRNSSSGLLISSIKVAYQVVLEVGCYDLQVGMRLEAWNWANHEILLQRGCC
ncbi:U3 small nucleolar RNA-associated protein 20-like [Pyrus ussuriensis x Pyrus communis]|uniref:U3 small nucleolar RNA-associated protein 20-like n=1 Tax=Pyrus ussuriensis x Pyrus communis TaxID=2448454 RepID=A0A5N5GIJ5_9ROSA|nr:U3 small nucleolar RNA-associated protein 20-like [Pyrus ussuriensis x Pyrus communis]